MTLPTARLHLRPLFPGVRIYLAEAPPFCLVYFNDEAEPGLFATSWDLVLAKAKAKSSNV